MPTWPHVYPPSGASATLKRLNEDFTVIELPLQLPSGEGEHVWLDIERNGAGSYATSVLNEILHTTEPDRHAENESAAVE